MSAKEAGKKEEFFIVAGETSGEQYGALLAAELKKRRPGCSIVGVGGDSMKEEGVELLHHVKDLAVVGFTDVLARFRTLKAIFEDTVKEVLERRPAALVLIDYPGFNLRLAKRIHGSGIPVVYYISPQIWAWHRKRVHDIGRTCDKILVVFDFEVNLYADEGYKAIYVGHPLLDRMRMHEIRNIREELNIPQERRIIGLLPGSRKQEIERLLPIYLDAAEMLVSNEVADLEFHLALAPLADRKAVEAMLSARDVPVKVFEGRSYDVMASSDLLFVASGTATLEAAVIGTPMIVTYKTGAITYLVGKSVLNVDWLALPNIIANAEIVPELLQDNLRPEYLAALSANLLTDKEAWEEMKAALAGVRARLGGPGASARAAEEIIEAAGLA